MKHRKDPDIRRWDPCSQSSQPWDKLRRDTELWLPSGDCLVHLYERGRSRRGPSFKISLGDLDVARCTDLASLPIDRLVPAAESSPVSAVGAGPREVYVAAPDDVPPFQWHVTTRNFFAWVTKKPLVGATLGEALIDLLDRMQLYRPQADNTGDILAYVEHMEYLRFDNCPDHALALLRFAEHYQLEELWIDAFSHCVGMSETLCSSREFDALSRVTKSLITRASLEMDLHLGRVTKALNTFLIDELTPTNFGLSSGAHAHLNHFRSFLHSFYIGHFGEWPLQAETVLSKQVLVSMCGDFQALYERLVDNNSTDSVQDLAKPASGGICVFQNIDAFNKRHNYAPLPCYLPLLPDYHSTSGKTQSQRSLRTFKLGSKTSKFEEGMTIRSALAIATNSVARGTSECQLVSDYERFEREWSARPAEKLSVVDARKVRWIVIYSILQMLVSATRSPKEVRQPHAASYHLCVLTEGTPPWGSSEARAAIEYGKASTQDEASQIQALALDEHSHTPVNIRPDCEADFHVPRAPETGPALKPAPLRISIGNITRMNSFRSLGRKVLSNPYGPNRRDSTSTAPLSHTAEDDCSRSPSPTTQPRQQAPADRTVDDLEASPQQAEEPASEVREPVLDALMLDNPYDSDPSSSIPSTRPPSWYSPMSVSSSPWRLDDTDTFSWTSGDERRHSRGIYSMEHESVYSSGSGSTCKLGGGGGGFSSPSSPSIASRSASGFFSLLSAKSVQAPDSSLQARASKDEEAACREVHRDYDEDSKGVEAILNRDVQIDIHRALDLLPLHIPAQAF